MPLLLFLKLLKTNVLIKNVLSTNNKHVSGPHQSTLEPLLKFCFATDSEVRSKPDFGSFFEKIRTKIDHLNQRIKLNNLWFDIHTV